MREATLLSNLWTDRRIWQRTFRGADRRLGLERRVRCITVLQERRSQPRRGRILWHSGYMDRLFLVLGDIASLLLALYSAWLVTNSGTGADGIDSYRSWWSYVHDHRMQIFLLLVSLTVLTFLISGHYAKRRPFWDELPSILKVILAVGCVDVAVHYILEWRSSPGWLFLTWLHALILVPAGRLLAKHSLIRLGGWTRPTVILGTGHHAQDAARALRSDPLLGYQVLAFLVLPKSTNYESTTDTSTPLRFLNIDGHRLPVYRISDDPCETLQRLGKPHVVAALDSLEPAEINKLLQKCHESFSSLTFAPAIRGLPLIGTEILHCFRHEVMFLQIRNNLQRRIPQYIKRGFDVVVSGLLLLLLSPLFALLAWRISNDGASPFFGHVRVGQDGKFFRCYKFRSMVPNAEQVLSTHLCENPAAKAEWEQNFKLKEDPRITPLGHVLRKTSLDELPQLWNVLRGEMSLVGPRPIVAAELEYYGDYSNYYLQAKPGITGLWQISGRNDVSYQERVALDTWYVKNWTLWYDIVILLKTVHTVTAKNGAY